MYIHITHKFICFYLCIILTYAWRQCIYTECARARERVRLCVCVFWKSFEYTWKRFSIDSQVCNGGRTRKPSKWTWCSYLFDLSTSHATLIIIEVACVRGNLEVCLRFRANICTNSGASWTQYIIRIMWRTVQQLYQWLGQHKSAIKNWWLSYVRQFSYIRLCWSEINTNIFTQNVKYIILRLKKKTR